jgi:hypothetical protein
MGVVKVSTNEVAYTFQDAKESTGAFLALLDYH